MTGVNLTKRTQLAGAMLAKKGLTAPPIMRVGLAIDISGSMADEFADGSVQMVIDQMLGIAAKFDDDGSIDIFQFDDRADYVGVCEASNYGNYVTEAGLRVRGGTAYSPCVRLITEHMFSASPTQAKSGMFSGLFGKKAPPSQAPSSSDIPVLIFFITDGAPYSEGRSVSAQYSAIKPAFEAAQAHPVYFQMIGINNQSDQFEVIEKLADDLPNVGFVGMNGFGKTDEQLYSEVISDELVSWVKTAGRGNAQATA